MVNLHLGLQQFCWADSPLHCKCPPLACTEITRPTLQTQEHPRSTTVQHSYIHLHKDEGRYDGLERCHPLWRAIRGSNMFRSCVHLCGHHCPQCASLTVISLSTGFYKAASFSISLFW